MSASASFTTSISASSIATKTPAQTPTPTSASTPAVEKTLVDPNGDPVPVVICPSSAPYK